MPRIPQILLDYWQRITGKPTARWCSNCRTMRPADVMHIQDDHGNCRPISLVGGGELDDDTVQRLLNVRYQGFDAIVDQLARNSGWIAPSPDEAELFAQAAAAIAKSRRRRPRRRLARLWRLFLWRTFRRPIGPAGPQTPGLIIQDEGAEYDRDWARKLQAAARAPGVFDLHHLDLNGQPSLWTSRPGLQHRPGKTFLVHQILQHDLDEPDQK